MRRYDHGMRLPSSAAVLLALSATLGAAPPGFAVAHRGASAYAPEHTLEAYRLAIEQGAEYVEQDLSLTKDGVLVCSHDPSLERTTNVEYPDAAPEIRKLIDDTVRDLPESRTALTDQMRKFVEVYKVDGLFTDNPDLFPR